MGKYYKKQDKKSQFIIDLSHLINALIMENCQNLNDQLIKNRAFLKNVLKLKKDRFETKRLVLKRLLSTDETKDMFSQALLLKNQHESETPCAELNSNQTTEKTRLNENPLNLSSLETALKEVSTNCLF